MVNPEGKTRRSESGSMETNDKQKKQNTQNISTCQPEQTIRVTTWHAFLIFEGRKENGSRNSEEDNLKTW